MAVTSTHFSGIHNSWYVIHMNKFIMLLVMNKKKRYIYIHHTVFTMMSIDSWGYHSLFLALALPKK